VSRLSGCSTHELADRSFQTIDTEPELARHLVYPFDLAAMIDHGELDVRAAEIPAEYHKI
jgi:hypothetical protein